MSLCLWFGELTLGVVARMIEIMEAMAAGDDGSNVALTRVAVLKTYL